MKSRQQIAEDLLGCALDDGLFAPCPGAAKHSKSGGRRDFRVVLDGAPTAFCFHSSCAGEVEAFNKELRRRIWMEEHGGLPSRAQPGWEGLPQEPKAKIPNMPEINMAMVEEFTRGMPSLDTGWFARRSPVDVKDLSTADFLDALYYDEERVCVFTEYFSQGEFLFWRGRGSYRLAKDKGVKAVPSNLPTTGREGVWYLVQPVSGKWEINPDPPKKDPERHFWTRRSKVNVTSWRYFVLESDKLDDDLWFKVVAALKLPIVAIYTSGGRSIHALVKYQVTTTAGWDGVKNALKQVVCPLGADPAALTAVRLSRLPGCMREGTKDSQGRYVKYPSPRKQRLLYLNPRAEAVAIQMMPEVRV